MFGIVRSLIGLVIFIFIVSLFTDPVELAREAGMLTGQVVSGFVDGFSES